MGAAAAGDDELSAAVAGKEERIVVSVRVRPLNTKEIDKGDSSDWDCVNNTTIVFKYPPQGERALFPTSYKFGEFKFEKSWKFELIFWMHCSGAGD
jgi:centromeric protein E